MQEKQLDKNGWLVLVGQEDDVLTLSALFDVHYKPMGESDIALSNTITLLDQQGVIKYQLKGISESTDKMVNLIEALNK